MKVSLLQQVKLAGLTVAVAALSHQPNILSANAQTLTSLTEVAAQPTLINPSVAKASVVKASVAKASVVKAVETVGAAAKAAIKSASFVNGTGHTVTGGVKIIEEDGQRYLELGSDFRTDSGPDLFVLLHREAVPTGYADSDYVSLGRLQRVARTQRYLIPAGVDISAFGSAVIWCRQFNVTFGYASL